MDKLHPEELVELKEWAESDPPSQFRFGYTRRNWIRDTVLKLINAYEARLTADRCRTHREIENPPPGMGCPECGEVS